MSPRTISARFNARMALHPIDERNADAPTKPKTRLVPEASTLLKEIISRHIVSAAGCRGAWRELGPHP